MSSFDVARLTLHERTGTYANGKARIRQILEAAYDVMIAEGIAAISLRGVARRCGIRVGTVNYYYKSRAALIQDLIECTVAPYYEVYDDLVEDTAFTPTDRLTRLILAILDDIGTEKTTKLFPELWTSANRDSFIAELVDHIYARQRISFERLIALINPHLEERSRKLVALYTSASIEGQTIFVGFNKPYADDILAIGQIAVKSIVDMVGSITNESIDPSRRGS